MRRHRKPQAPPVRVIECCLHCNTLFITYANGTNHTHHCSSACYHAAWKGRERKHKQRRSTKLCATCGKEFVFRPCEASKAHCSAACYWLAMRSRKGALSSGWKGGVYTGTRATRNSLEMKNWRILVFLRDRFICQKCGQWGGKLEAHHIKEFAKYPELRFEISNGVTLCKPCHRGLHRVSSRRQRRTQ
jgi:hypothetical protein